MSISIIRSCLLIKYSLLSLHGIPKSHIFNPNWWEKVRDHWRKYHVTFHPTYHVTFHPMKSRGVRALCMLYGCTRHTFIFYLCSTAPLSIWEWIYYQELFYIIIYYIISIIACKYQNNISSWRLHLPFRTTR